MIWIFDRIMSLLVSKRLSAICNVLKKPADVWHPRQVLLFSGHMVDAPDRATPRFPWDKVAVAEAAITKGLDDLDAGPDDLALTQGTSDADLIFAEACQARGVRLQLMQPFPEPKFIEQSVAPAEIAGVKPQLLAGEQTVRQEYGCNKQTTPFLFIERHELSSYELQTGQEFQAPKKSSPAMVVAFWV